VSAMTSGGKRKPANTDRGGIAPGQGRPDHVRVVTDELEIEHAEPPWREQERRIPQRERAAERAARPDGQATTPGLDEAVAGAGSALDD